MVRLPKSMPMVAGLLLAAMAVGSAGAQMRPPFCPLAAADDCGIGGARHEAAPARVEATLAAMTAAVLAGDADGYLKNVWTGDAEFLKEQQNWAADLKRQAPEAFALELTRAPELGDGWADAEMTMRWTMPGGKPRSVASRVRFVWANGSWLYAGERWDAAEGPGVRVLYEGDLAEVARTVVEIMPDIQAHVLEGFELGGGALAGRVQTVKLYQSMAHLQASIYPSYRDSLAGWNEPQESIKILARRGTAAHALRVILSHEYGHVATFELGPRANEMPWWVLEGVADLSAQKYTGDEAGNQRRVERWSAEGKLRPWSDLADFHGEAPKYSSFVYQQGRSMVAYVTERAGRTGRNRWLTRMALGGTLDEATNEVLGVSFAELDRAWRERLDERAAEGKGVEGAAGPRGK